ncbi:MAG: MBOAT family O-acyltransferase, partial [Aggregatilineales bacterium]
TWFRDYVYIPLGGNRVGFGRMLLNLGIVFVVSGLWHGANWTFVIWGTLHGGFIIIETVYERWQSRPKISQNALTVLMHRVLTFGLVMLAWIFFRANTLDDALYVLQHLFDFSGGAGNITQPAGDALIGTRLSFILLLIAPCALLFFEWANSRYAIAKRAMQIIWLRWLLYYTATLLILWSLARITDSQPFIYFRF